MGLEESFPFVIKTKQTSVFIPESLALIKQQRPSQEHTSALPYALTF
jgi:hypothetical protein